MKPAQFAYHDPKTVADAVALLGSLENVRALAGGQSLVPMMNFRFATPDHLVDLNGIPELTGIRSNGAFSFGAMTRQRDIEFSEEVAQKCPIIQEALLNVGHRQTRNRGTIGGSVCHLDPAAEMPAMMLLHDAALTARSAAGQRTIPMSEFALGYMATAIEPHELLVDLTFDLWPRGHGYAFEEYARRHGDFAIASVGVLLDLAEDDSVRRIAVVVGGLGSVPLRLTDFEAAAVGQPAADALVAEASRAATQTEALDDAHVSAKYRRHLASVLAARAMRRAIARAREGRNSHV